MQVTTVAVMRQDGIGHVPGPLPKARRRQILLADPRTESKDEVARHLLDVEASDAKQVPHSGVVPDPPLEVGPLTAQLEQGSPPGQQGERGVHVFGNDQLPPHDLPDRIQGSNRIPKVEKEAAHDHYIEGPEVLRVQVVDARSTPLDFGLEEVVQHVEPASPGYEVLPAVVEGGMVADFRGVVDLREVRNVYGHHFCRALLFHVECEQAVARTDVEAAFASQIREGHNGQGVSIVEHSLGRDPVRYVNGVIPTHLIELALQLWPRHIPKLL